jgi:hypothetical protein
MLVATTQCEQDAEGQGRVKATRIAQTGKVGSEHVYCRVDKEQGGRLVVVVGTDIRI